MHHPDIIVPFSVLDLAPIVQGGNAAQALRNSIDLAQHAERWGYTRYWVAEHHNIPSVASSATAVVIAAIAGHTSTIRVGAGGIMLPNHAPLVIAEQFGTLESLFQNRIDLALGRAPGSDQLTARALRRTLASDVDSFPQDVIELVSYFHNPAGQAVKAIPGAGLKIPIWILGSSLFGAALAAELGLPFAFASHFAPVQMMDALQTYRSRFRPSQFLGTPYVMLGVNIVVAESDQEARVLFTSHQQVFANLRRGTPTPLPPPDPDAVARLSTEERREIDSSLSMSMVGSIATVQARLERFLAETRADELIVVSQIYDHAARVRSYELTSGVCQRVGVRLAP